MKFGGDLKVADDFACRRNFWAGRSSSGSDVFEELLVRDLGDGNFQVLKSPGLVLGLANGDEVSFDESTGKFAMRKRGGQVALQLYLGTATESHVAALAQQLAFAAQATWDGLSSQLAVFSFQVSKGFGAAEGLLDEFVRQHKGAEWFYGNVYADDGITPLDWWT